MSDKTKVTIKFNWSTVAKLVLVSVLTSVIYNAYRIDDSNDNGNTEE